MSLCECCLGRMSKKNNRLEGSALLSRPVALRCLLKHLVLGMSVPVRGASSLRSEAAQDVRPLVSSSFPLFFLPPYRIPGKDPEAAQQVQPPNKQVSFICTSVLCISSLHHNAFSCASQSACTLNINGHGLPCNQSVELARAAVRAEDIPACSTPHQEVHSHMHLKLGP